MRQLLAVGGRERPHKQSLPASVAKPQSAPVKSWIDRTSTQPTAGVLELGTGTGPYGDCLTRPSVVWLCGLDSWSLTRAVWAVRAALKKTLELEALYTTMMHE